MLREQGPCCFVGSHHGGDATVCAAEQSHGGFEAKQFSGKYAVVHTPGRESIGARDYYRRTHWSVRGVGAYWQSGKFNSLSPRYRKYVVTVNSGSQLISSLNTGLDA